MQRAIVIGRLIVIISGGRSVNSFQLHFKKSRETISHSTLVLLLLLFIVYELTRNFLSLFLPFIELTTHAHCTCRNEMSASTCEPHTLMRSLVFYLLLLRVYV